MDAVCCLFEYELEALQLSLPQEPRVLDWVHGSMTNVGAKSVLSLQGQTTDSQTVLFATSTTQYNQEVIQSTNSGAPPPPSTPSSATALTCSARCGISMNIACYMRYKCWKLLGGFMGLIAGLAALGE